MLLSITAPGRGFAVTLDGHTWLFDRGANIVGCLPPPRGHLPVRNPENCPGCVEFIVRTRGQAGE
jgi:hypothetical protein